MTIDRSKIPAAWRAKFDQAELRETPSLTAFRFGNTKELRKLTNEATQLAIVADGAKSAWRGIFDKTWRLRADTSLPADKATSEAARYAKKAIQQQERQFDRAVDAADKRLGQLKSLLDEALRPPTGTGTASIDAELRSLIRNTQDEAKQLRLAHGNPGAVARAPAVLSGVTDDIHQRIVGEYLREVKPDEFAQYSDLRQSLQSAITAREELDKSSRNLIDFETSDKIESLQDQAPAAA